MLHVSLKTVLAPEEQMLGLDPKWRNYIFVKNAIRPFLIAIYIPRIV